MNPKLVDVAAAEIEPGKKPIAVRLRVDFKFDLNQTVDDSYVLNQDLTNPTVTIVSPRDGDRVPTGKETDVFISSFDTYGIDQVEVSLDQGASWSQLENPNRFTFTPNPATPLEVIQIDARAIDSNGNVGFATPVQVVSFDPNAGEPRVELLLPDNGAEFHSGEAIEVEVRLVNLTDADLYFDVGGVESGSTSIPISRTGADPERFVVTTALPVVSEDVVVVLRLQSSALKARRYVSVLFDDGIEQA
ncbi:MAG: hypothetical protein GY741_17145, partial [Phycisphaeraceae bacterium]|nr:hypothetical protein [Phycisphaeraceae bacterium]